MSPNVLAPLALTLFPVVVVVLFVVYRPTKAVAVSLLAGELLLPSNYALPFAPSWLSTKWIIPPFFAGLVAPVLAGRQLRGTRAFAGAEGIFLFALIANFMTYWTNRTPVVWGPTILPALTVRDLIGDMIRSFADPWVAFFLGRALFKTSRDLRELCRLVVGALILYSVLILFEVRMSPCLNRWIYGYQASGFAMTVRWGGYRPTVFFKDGLPLASFVLTGTLMAVAMLKAKVPVPYIPRKYAALYLILVLVLCKSTGAIAYAVLAIPLIWFAAPPRTLLVATILTVVFVAYPFLRTSNLLPLDSIVDFFSGVSTDRSGSLSFRFEMEKGVLDRAMLNPLWGWGGWGRNFVYDSVHGDQVSALDGAVAGMVSTHGFVGFLTYFLPFSISIVRARKMTRKIKSREDRILIGALALNMSIVLLDLTINSAFDAYDMLMLGALYSLPAGIVAEEEAAAYAVPDYALVASAYAPP
jgi:hypothetical protein